MIRLLVTGTFLALLTFWLHRRYVRAPELRGAAAITATTVLVAGAALALIGSLVGTTLDPQWSRPLGFLGWTWLAVVLYLALGAIVIGLTRLANRLTWSLRGTERPTEPNRLRALRITTAVAAVLAFGAVAYGTVEASNPKIERAQVPLERLPDGFDGMRVALVTDLHVGPARGADFTRKVVDLVAAEKPDLIVLGGDLSDGTIARVAADIEPLRDLDAPLGVFGVSGNHEYYSDDALSWLDHWETLGVQTLRNEHVTLTRGTDSIDIAGVHDWTAPAPDEADLAAALDGRTPDRFVLLAAHQPRQVLDAADLGVDLQLSGHTHGGQMWPLGVFVALANPSVAGLDQFGDTTLYTSRGTGAWGPPVRVATPPEITILELVSAPA
ncbi:MAG: metallophosphoesterase [Rhodococcus sp. (in: high G+C Gram-positive bacteria)]|uniref:metallophosphoesterase n=1 Tax=Rhodococcus sp. TaxID=1831 RepID=UPI003BB7A4D2